MADIRKIDSPEILTALEKIFEKSPGSAMRKADAAVALQKIQTSWAHIVGEALATHSAPTWFDGNTLHITADHPLFASQLTMLSRPILQAVWKISGVRVTGIKPVHGKVKFALAKEEDIMSPPPTMTQKAEESPLSDWIRELESI